MFGPTFASDEELVLELLKQSVCQSQSSHQPFGTVIDTLSGLNPEQIPLDSVRTLRNTASANRFIRRPKNHVNSSLTVQAQNVNASVVVLLELLYLAVLSIPIALMHPPARYTNMPVFLFVCTIVYL